MSILLKDYALGHIFTLIKSPVRTNVPESVSPLVCLVASHSLSPSPSLFPSLSPFLSLFLSPVLSPCLGHGSALAPGLGSALGFSAGCRDERTTWSSSAGTGVLVHYQEPNISDTKHREIISYPTSLP